MYSAVEKDCIEICRETAPDLVMYHYGIGLGASIAEYFNIPAFEVRDSALYVPGMKF
jgi:hypothetical protein